MVLPLSMVLPECFLLPHLRHISFITWVYGLLKVIFTPQSLKAMQVLFSLMASAGWVGGRKEKMLSGLYLRNHKVQEVDS